jgi:hypothetical protein
MSSATDSTSMHLFKSSFYGLLRGFIVQPLIQPLEVIKIRQQCSTHPEKCRKVALTIFKQEGSKAFYRGLSPQLLSTCLKQMWCWPMITGIPCFLERHQITDMRREIFTGLSIATIEAVTSAPFEQAKIRSASSGKSLFCLQSISLQGWQSVRTYWVKLAVHWPTFLVAQTYLRNRALSRVREGEQLTMPQLSIIGTETAMFTSLIATPFDMANTVKHAKNVNASYLLSKKAVVQAIRVLPIHFISLSVHNIGSAIVFDKLSKDQKDKISGAL